MYKIVEMGVMLMPRAKLTYDNRCWLEQAFKEGMDPMKICEYLGISTHQLQLEKKLGWDGEEKAYSAHRAQLKLK